MSPLKTPLIWHISVWLLGWLLFWLSWAVEMMAPVAFLLGVAWVLTAWISRDALRARARQKAKGHESNDPGAL